MRKVLYLILFLTVTMILVSCTNVNQLVGTWVNVDDQVEVVTIEKSGKNFFWNEGDEKFSAYYKDNSLYINVGFGEAVAYYDKKSENMILTFMGEQNRYIRNNQKANE